jgi:hypothetical protein
MRRKMARKVLLSCGILSSLLYVAMNVLAAMRYEGYRSASQTISELSAIGAPSRPLWVGLGIVYTLLVAAFGWGVWRSAGTNGRLRVVGALFVANGLIGLAWPPMHPRGTVVTLTDTLHIVFTMATVLLMMLAIGFGAGAFGRRFRRYSIATLVILVAFGALTGLEGPRVAANLPTPWIGVWERINIGAYLQWVVVLAASLLRAPETARGRRQLGMSEVPVHGFVRPGFEAVRDAFADNFSRRGELGGACCVASTGTAKRWSTSGAGSATRRPASPGKRTPWSWCTRPPRASRP